MKSTGEVMGSDRTFAKALYKAFAGAKMQLPENGNVLLTIDDRDKEKILPIAKRFIQIGYRIFATKGTTEFLRKNNLHAELVTKVHEDEGSTNNILNKLKNDTIDLVINTMGHDLEKNSDGFIIRQLAIQQNVPLLTALDTADALLTSLENRSFVTQSLA
ncbi:methylglyoxal synthase [Lactobacillus colini]|uniref:carbamoyl-phosphate synthase (glutamine-hydrolyzing) n=1 Tax=Lactobacillus colini TaxID=1819254 RepID=A0ABS4MBZ6_9LACO|nr:methylglyoxal synthase [Lactobacillus colini]